MNVIATIEPSHLPAMIDRAAQALLNAKTSAEVLEAKEMAGFVYDAAKRSARLSKAKDAHDSLIAAAHRAQADALDIEAQAKRRLADEYDAAQERGEVGQSGARTDLVPKGNEVVPPASAAGLSRKTIHEARQVRDAEAAEPGIVRRTLDDKLSRGEEPTRAALREVVTAAAVRGMRAEPSTGRKNPLYEPPTPAGSAWAHLYGSCGRMLEWATDEKIRLAIEGLAERTDDQAANLREVREWAARLNQIVEMIDAE